MTLTKILVGLILTALTSCGKTTERQKPDPAAVQYNNQAMALVAYIDNFDSAKKALTLLEKATQIDSNYFLGHSNKLMFYYQLKQFDKALKTNTKLIQLCPNAHDLYLQSGILSFQLGDTISARKYFEKSLSICNAVLDTMQKTNRDFVLLTTNKAINLIYLDDTKQANKLLLTLYDALPSYTEFDKIQKKGVKDLMGKSKKDLLASFKNP
jgi:tetratricopeptide (TPR) repeat protein